MADPCDPIREEVAELQRQLDETEPRLNDRHPPVANPSYVRIERELNAARRRLAACESPTPPVIPPLITLTHDHGFFTSSLLVWETIAFDLADHDITMPGDLTIGDVVFSSLHHLDEGGLLVVLPTSPIAVDSLVPYATNVLTASGNEAFRIRLTRPASAVGIEVYSNGRPQTLTAFDGGGGVLASWTLQSAPAARRFVGVLADVKIVDAERR